MLTPRGWWFVVLVLTIGAAAGVLALRHVPALWLCSLTIVLWLAWEWGLFLYRARLVTPRITIERFLADDRGPVATLWTHQAYRVHVRVSLPRGRLPIVDLIDRPPAGANLIGDASGFAGQLAAGAPATWEGRLRCERPGVVRFEGVRVRLTDAQGFFYLNTFARDPREWPVLPGEEAGDVHRSDKRVNMLPPPGVHRHRRPGTGSELLELRDYRPGDPPRRIAWKVSARRDQLITREYEAEVPLRCTLIIDASAATRYGSPGLSPLARFAGIAAGVARTAIANRDLVGLAVCTENGFDYRPPARNSAHLIAILETLARTASLQPEAATDEVAPLLSRAYALAADIYPELIDAKVNYFPAWLPWISPPPVYVRRAGRSPRWSWWRSIQQINSPGSRRRQAWRKRLAALLCAKYSLDPGALGLLLEDDLAMATWLQRFLAEHRVPYDLPGYDTHGRDILATPDAPAVQAKALIQAVGRGRDNELFVLLGDYVRRPDSLGQLLKAVRVARGRHHQVLVVQTGRPADDPGPCAVDALPKSLTDHAERALRFRTWSAARRSFGRFGVPIVPADAGDPARLILHRLEQLRSIQGAGSR